MVVAVAGVHRVMVELATATDKAGKAIAEGKTQLQKTVEMVRHIVFEFPPGGQRMWGNEFHTKSSPKWGG